MHRSRLLRSWSSAIVLGVLAVAGPVSAQPADGEAPPADEAAAPDNLEAAQGARRHFLAGIEHFEEHRYREAIQAFQLAAQLVPSADLWYNIARAHEELSEYELAIEHYQRYLRDRVDPPDRARVEAHIEELRERAAAERERARTEPTEGVLRLTANRDDAEVRLDGEPAGRSPWDEPRELEAGRHDLSVLRQGYVPFRSEVSVEAGVTTAAYADLVPETRFRAIRNDPVFSWIAWGLGVASLGVSIGLGVEAASRQSTDLDSARTVAAFSDAALAGAVGFGVLGLVLWFVEGRTVGTERITVEDEGPATVRGP
ncbi:MAG TPA: PEGA domain-containing protein [Sandaracinaceae bacterium LLY-WYZ-13_1]|nr:PEGA domain-containing protein [Sandaracinaceae bacterium LLY-WYZ-13_1]